MLSWQNAAIRNAAGVVSDLGRRRLSETYAMRQLLAGLLCWSLLAAMASAAEPDKAALAQKAQAVLKANCYRCHGQDGGFERCMNFILDTAKLVTRKKIVTCQ